MDLAVSSAIPLIFNQGSFWKRCAYWSKTDLILREKIMDHLSHARNKQREPGSPSPQNKKTDA
jgi:hypothetical protein